MIPGIETSVRSEGFWRFGVEYLLVFLNTFRKLEYEHTRLLLLMSSNRTRADSLSHQGWGQRTSRQQTQWELSWAWKSGQVLGRWEAMKGGHSETGNGHEPVGGLGHRARCRKGERPRSGSVRALAFTLRWGEPVKAVAKGRDVRKASLERAGGNEGNWKKRLNSRGGNFGSKNV